MAEASMGLKKSFLAAAFLLFSSNIFADYPDYVSHIKIQGNEKIIERDKKNSQIRHNCENETLEEAVLRAFVQEERINVKKELEGLDYSMSELVGGTYSDSRSISNKLNKIFKAKIPAWAFAFQYFDAKLLVLQQGVQTRKIANDAFEATKNIEEGRDYNYYALNFSRLNNAKNMTRVVRKFIKSIKDMSELGLIFTNDEIEKIKRAEKSLDIKSIEEMALEKLEKFSELKEIKRINDKKLNDLKNTDEYKQYLKDLSNAKERVSLYNLIKNEYSIINSSPELIKDEKMPVSMWYNSPQGARLSESIDLETKIEKTKINENRSNFRLWLFSKDWDKEKRFIWQHYFISLPKSVLIIHPKGMTIDNLFEESYVYDNKISGEWERSLPEGEDIGLVMETRIKKYIMKEIISNTIRGYIIKTGNVVEWISWKIVEMEKITDEKRKQGLIKMLEDYEITEIPIYPSIQSTAKYLGFSMENTGEEVYALTNVKVECDSEFGEIENLVSFKRGFNEKEYSKDANIKDSDKKAIDAIEKMNFDRELYDFIEDFKRKSFAKSIYLKKCEFYEIKQADKDDAYADYETVIEAPCNSVFPMINRMTDKGKMHFKKENINGKYRWKIIKSESNSFKNENVFSEK